VARFIYKVADFLDHNPTELSGGSRNLE